MKRYAISFVGFVTLMHAGAAFATHKNWVLKDDGAECTFTNALESDQQDYGLQNMETYARTATCPISLAARWGCSGGTQQAQFPPPLWGDAMAAVVYGTSGWWSTDPPVACSAQMETSDGSVYYSGTVSAPWDTAARIVLAAPGSASPYKSQWVSSGGGSDLQANENLTAKSMWFSCQVPLFAAITGYGVRICESYAGCNDGNSTDPDLDLSSSFLDTSSPWNYFQTSGIECVPSSDRTSLLYTDNGIQNVDSTNHRGVYCPIITPSSDTWETYRQLRYTRVYYSGGSTSTNCADADTCPQCSFNWYDKNGATWAEAVSGSTSYFEYDPYFTSANTVYQGSSQAQYETLGQEVAVEVYCDLPPGVTLRGISGQAMVSGIQLGL
jgi:hypothetical protein